MTQKWQEQALDQDPALREAAFRTVVNRQPERLGAAHRIVTSKSQDQSSHHQITNAPGSREQFQGPVQPFETKVGPNNLNTANGLDYLTPKAQARADEYTKAHTEYFRKHGHGI